MPNLVSTENDAYAVYQLVEANGWGDGLPVIPATADRVREFVEYVQRPADDVIGLVAPFQGVASVEYLAINAIMAGCLPEHLPVLIAAVEAITDPAFDLDSVQADTNPCTPMIIVSGPIRESIGMNWAGNVLGGENRANVTIGRALRLIMRNIGRARAPEVDASVHGFPGKVSFCIAEDEAGSPWEPLHVERGLAPGASAVTVMAATGSMNVVTGVHAPDAMLTMLADNVCGIGMNQTLLSGVLDGGPVIVISAQLANLLARDGLSKSDVKRIIAERAHKPESAYPMGRQADDRKLALIRDGEIWALRNPDAIKLVVAGSDSPNHVAIIPNYCVSETLTREIRVPGPV